MNEYTTTFNINDKVKVKLTERGRELLYMEWVEMKKPGDFNIDVDSEGYTEFEMWNLMLTFGERIFGSQIPFLPNMKLSQVKVITNE